MMGLWLLAGGVVGLLNSLTRWWTVARLRSDMERSALVLTLGGLVVRLALIAALLISGLRSGIIPGLLVFGGLWLTRMAAVIWVQALGALWASDATDEDRSGSPEWRRGRW